MEEFFSIYNKSLVFVYSYSMHHNKLAEYNI